MRTSKLCKVVLLPTEKAESGALVHRAKSYSRKDMIEAWKCGQQYELESNKGYGPAEHLSLEEYIKDNL
jgi:hypothetical protein